MIVHRKVGGVSDGYVVKIGNIEIAYNYHLHGSRLPNNDICRPPIDFSQNIYATRPAIGAFKIDGEDWIVCKGGYYSSEPHPFLVSKFAKPKDRLDKEVFMPLFMEAYSKALIVESRRVLDKLNKGELNL